jgi:hypothetical protein
MTYNKLRRHADAEAVLAKYQESVRERTLHLGLRGDDIISALELLSA